MQNNFKDEDKAKLIKFLNMNAEKAKFTLTTEEIIEYFKLLTFMQKELLPKVDSHILEIKRVIESEDKK